MKITSFFISILMLAFSIKCQAQEVTIGNIAYAVEMRSSNISDAGIRARVKSKLIQIASFNRVSGLNNESGFKIIPMLDILDEASTNNGIRKSTTIQIELVISTINQFTNEMFNSIVVNSTGTASSRNQAIQTALNKIKTSNHAFSSFFKESDERVIGYYAANCDLIANRANSLMNNHSYEEAICLLMSVPQEIHCSSIKNTLLECFGRHQDKICYDLILEAKTVLARDRYRNSLEILKTISSDSDCYDEATAMVYAIDTKIRDIKIAIQEREREQARQIMRQIQEERDSKERMHAVRYNTMASIANSYYANNALKIKAHYRHLNTMEKLQSEERIQRIKSANRPRPTPVYQSRPSTTIIQNTNIIQQN